jgi:tetratricopeptide (TPR) repeat protein
MLACILAAGCSAARGVSETSTAPRADGPAAEADAVASTPASRAAAGAQSPTLISVPFFAQREHECGPAALAMALAWSGTPAEPDALTGELLTPERKGTLQPDLIAAARRHDRVAYVIAGRAELDAELRAGNPVIVLQNLGLGWVPRWHYAVVIGYEDAAGDFVLHSGTHEARRVGERTFDNTWERAARWGLLVLPPDRLPATAAEQRWLQAAAGLEAAGRFLAAASAYRTALARWPQSLAAGIGLANAQYASADLTGAAETLRATVRLHPESADAWNNLAQVLADQGWSAQAKGAARRAIALGGANAAVYEQTLSELEAR